MLDVKTNKKEEEQKKYACKLVHIPEYCHRGDFVQKINCKVRIKPVSERKEGGKDKREIQWYFFTEFPFAPERERKKKEKNKSGEIQGVAEKIKGLK